MACMKLGSKADAFQRQGQAWLKPKKLEKLLKAQGLQGDPYKLNSNSVENLKETYMQQEAKSEPFGVSAHVTPHIFSTLHQTVYKYGKNSFMWEGGIPKVIITEPEHIKEVFNKINDFTRPESHSIAKFFTVGLLGIESEKWAKHRKIINPAFHIDRLKNMLPKVTESSNDMVSKWKKMLLPDGSCEIDVWPFIQNLTCDVISRTAFGSSYAEGTKIFELLKRQGYILMTARKTSNPLQMCILRENHLQRMYHSVYEAAILEVRHELKSGVLERLIAKASESEEACAIHLEDIPGGAKAFELVAKFCYGVKLELTASNVVYLWCAAEFLLLMSN